MSKVCRHYRRGYCQLGSKCGFKHVSPSETNQKKKPDSPICKDKKGSVEKKGKQVDKTKEENKLKEVSTVDFKIRSTGEVEFKRFRYDNPPTFDELLKKICSIKKISSNLKISYKDNQGDMLIFDSTLLKELYEDNIRSIKLEISTPQQQKKNRSSVPQQQRKYKSKASPRNTPKNEFTFYITHEHLEDCMLFEKSVLPNIEVKFNPIKINVFVKEEGITRIRQKIVLRGLNAEKAHVELKNHSTIKKKEIKLDPEIQEHFHKNRYETSTKDVDIIPLGGNLILFYSFYGSSLEEEIKRFEDYIRNSVRITKAVKFDWKTDGEFFGFLKRRYTNLELNSDVVWSFRSNVLTLKGKIEDVKEAEKQIKELRSNFKSTTIGYEKIFRSLPQSEPICTAKLSFVLKSKLKELKEELEEEHDVDVFIEKKNKVIVSSTKDIEVKESCNAIQQLIDSFQSKPFPLQPNESNLLKSTLRKDIAYVRELQDNFNVYIRIDNLTLYGMKESIDEVFEVLHQKLKGTKMMQLCFPIGDRVLSVVIRRHYRYFLKNHDVKCKAEFDNTKKNLVLLVKESEQESVKSQLDKMISSIRANIIKESIELSKAEESILKFKTHEMVSISNKHGVWYSLPNYTKLQYRFKYQGKVLEVQCGNILAQKADAIVNCANAKLDHCGGIASIIANHAGKELVDECNRYINQHGILKVSEVLITSSGNLRNCKNVIHAVGPLSKSNTEENQKRLIKLTVENILNAADKNNMKSIVIPAISSGIFGVSPKLSAKVIVETIKSYFDSNQKKNRSLNCIRLCDNNPSTSKEFVDYCELIFGKTNMDLEDEITFEVQYHKGAEYIFQWTDDDNKWKEYDSANNQKINNAYAGGQERVELIIDSGKYSMGAQYYVDLRTLQQVNKITGYKRAVRIVPNTNPGSSEVVPKGKKSSKVEKIVLTIQGHKNHVNNAIKEYKKMIHDNYSSQKLSLHSRISFDTARITCSKSLVEISKIDDNTIRIEGLDKRVNQAIQHLNIKIMEGYQGNSYPTIWGNQTKNLELVDVDEGSKEWNDVENNIKKTLDKEIYKIERVQNKSMYSIYIGHKNSLLEKYGKVNELSLYHGTSNTDPKNIYEADYGFDITYSGSGMWGKGLYFAENASYSYHYASTLGDGLIQFFLADVLVGESVELEPDQNIKRPTMNPITNLQYDSIKGSTGGSTVYVLYVTGKAYPKYLITLKR